jgi:hypothetical protein
LLGRDYIAIEPILRNKADMQSHMPCAFISTLCFSGAFVSIYSKGRGDRYRLGQGVRCGIAIWALASLPSDPTDDPIEPWPGGFVAKILAWKLITMAGLSGVTLALAKRDSRIFEGGIF